MKCGIITVEGNADDRVGDSMLGGIIVVNGHSGNKWIGFEAKGGEIHIIGDHLDVINGTS